MQEIRRRKEITHRATRRGIAALLLLAFASPLASAAPRQESESALSEELRYARGLASRFQFLDLAEDVIRSVSAKNLSPQEKESLALTQADIFAEAARFEPDPTKRLALFVQAIDAYRTFLEANPSSPYASDARRTYVNVGATYGWLVEQELAEASGEKAETLRKSAAERLERIARDTGTWIDLLGPTASLDELQKRELAQLLLSRGQIFLQLARLSPNDSSFFLATGQSALERLAFDMGADSGWAFNAYVLIAEMELLRDNADEALGYADYVVTSAIPKDRAEWDKTVREQSLTRGDKDARWGFVELATPLAIRCAQATNDSALAMQYALHFHNTRTREGFNLTQRGYLAQLDVARNLIESGGVLAAIGTDPALKWFATTEEATAAQATARSIRTATDLALQLAAQVNTENPRTFLQAAAQRVIAEAIAVPGVVVSTDVMFQAALGEFNAGNWEAAVWAFKRVLASTGSPAERTAWGGRVFLQMGRALRQQGRLLEAAMAFEEGARRYRQDAENAAECAKLFYETIGLVRRNAPNDQTIDSIWLEAERLAAEQATTDASEIYFRQAERAIAEGKHEDARQLFQQVALDARRGEQAKVKAGVALVGAGRAEEARAELVEYVDVFVKDPRHRLGPQDQARLDSRQAALAEAEYTIGRIDFEAGRWKPVLERFEGFAQRYPGQGELRAAALDHCVTAQVELGDIAAARRYLDRLRDEHGDANARISGAATRIYNALLARHGAVEGSDAEQARGLKRQMCEMLEIANRHSDKPPYQALQSEGLFWLELGEAEKAEAALRRFLKEYGSDEQLKQIRDTNIIPGLGNSLVHQRRAQEAYELLKPLMPDPANRDAPRPAHNLASAYVRSIAGWLDGAANPPTIVPGIGGLAPLREASIWQSRLKNRPDTPQWSCGWLEQEAQSVWILIQMGRLDSNQQNEARRAMTSLRAFLGEDFAKVRETCGNDFLQRRFQWLATQTR